MDLFEKKNLYYIEFISSSNLYLEEIKEWCYANCPSSAIETDYYNIHVKIAFKSNEDRAYFVLRWGEEEFGHAVKKVLLPRIRGLIQQKTINEILSVQPMTGDVGKIFTLGKKK